MMSLRPRFVAFARGVLPSASRELMFALLFIACWMDGKFPVRMFSNRNESLF